MRRPVAVRGDRRRPRRPRPPRRPRSGSPTSRHPGRAAALSRSGVRHRDHDQQRDLRQRGQQLGADGHAAARHLRAHRRHRDRAARDRVGARRLVLLRRQDLAGARRRSEHLRQEGLLQRLDQLSPRARRLLRGRADPDLHHRDPGSARGRADCRPVPADERGALRHRRRRASRSAARPPARSRR